MNMKNKKFFSARAVTVAAVLAIAVTGFRMPDEQERPATQSRARLSQPFAQEGAIATIPAVKDGTHYEIPLARVELRGW
jgi:hypothetical protein